MSYEANVSIPLKEGTLGIRFNFIADSEKEVRILLSAELNKLVEIKLITKKYLLKAMIGICNKS